MSEKIYSEAEMRAKLAAMVQAVSKLYYAAHWIPDRPVDAKRLWENVRDAVGFEIGNAPKRLGHKSASCADDCGGDTSEEHQAELAAMVRKLKTVVMVHRVNAVTDYHAILAALDEALTRPMQSALAEHDEGIRDAELLRFIHGMLLMLDYSHPPDELIGQATLRKALAEFEAKVRAEAFEAGLKVTRGDVAQCADEIAALQGALRELRDAVEPNRARLYACLDPSKYARIAMNIAAATALLEGK